MSPKASLVVCAALRFGVATVLVGLVGGVAVLLLLVQPSVAVCADLMAEPGGASAML